MEDAGEKEKDHSLEEEEEEEEEVEEEGIDFASSAGTKTTHTGGKNPKEFARCRAYLRDIIYKGAFNNSR